MLIIFSGKTESSQETFNTLITDTFRVSGTWTAPEEFYHPDGTANSALVECWGGGGGGSTNVGAGGGGAYARAKVTGLTPSTGYNVVVATTVVANTNGEDSTFDTNVVVAKGGLSGTNGGTGGQDSDCVGDIKYSGGNGSIGTGNRAGGGGAGSAGAGSAGSTTNPSTGGGDPDGGFGGNHGSSEAGFFGGGGGSSVSSQRPGKKGEVRISYLEPIEAGWPRVKGRSFGRSSTNNTSHSINMPSDIVAGELLLLIIGVHSAETVSITGWNKIVSHISSHTGSVNVENFQSLYCFYKIAEGSDTATAEISASQQIAYQVFRLENAGIPETATKTYATSIQTSPVSPRYAYSEGKGKILWLSAFIQINNNNQINAIPTNYRSHISVYGSTAFNASTQPDAIDLFSAMKYNEAQSCNQAFWETSTSSQYGSITIAIPAADFSGTFEPEDFGTLEAIIDPRENITHAGDGTAVSAWSSSYGSHTANIINGSPIYRGTGWNGNPVIEFDGVDDWIAFDSLASLVSGEDKPIHIIMAIQPLSLTADKTYWSFGRNTTDTQSYLSFNSNSNNSFIRTIIPDVGTENTSTTISDSHRPRHQIVSYTCSGIASQIHVNSIQKISSLNNSLNTSSSDVSALTVNQFTIGATRRATVSKHQKFLLGPILIYSSLNERLSPEEWLRKQGYEEVVHLELNTFTTSDIWEAPITGDAVVEVWGAGGGGTLGVGGGGGAAYNKNLININEGQSYDIVVAEGGAVGQPGMPSSFDKYTLMAAGGGAATWNSPGGPASSDLPIALLIDMIDNKHLSVGTGNRPLFNITNTNFANQSTITFSAGSQLRVSGKTASDWKFLHDGSGASAVVWFRSSASTGNTHPIFDTCSNTVSGVGVSLIWDAQNQRVTWLCTDGDGIDPVFTMTTTNGSVPRNQLNCLVVTNWNDAGTHKAEIYLNGSLLDGYTHSNPFSSSNPTNPLYVGTDSPTINSGFTGDIAELAFFNYALDSTEVSNIDTDYGDERYVLASGNEDETIMLTAIYRYRGDEVSVTYPHNNNPPVRASYSGANGVIHGTNGRGGSSAGDSENGSSNGLGGSRNGGSTGTAGAAATQVGVGGSSTGAVELPGYRGECRVTCIKFPETGYPTIVDRRFNREGNTSPVFRLINKAVDFDDILPGDLLVLAVGGDGTTGSIVVEGWNKISETKNSTVTMALFWKRATGEDTGVIETSARKTSHMLWQIRNADDPEFDVTSGTSGTPDSPEINLGEQKKALAISVIATDVSSVVELTSIPSGYGARQALPWFDTTSVFMASAEKNIDASSENPGAWGTTSEEWIAATIIVPYKNRYE